MLLRIPGLTLLLLPLTLQAALTRAYVDDRVAVQLRSSQSTQSRLLRTLTPGASVTVLRQNAKSGYSEIKLDSGETGWMLSRHLSEVPISSGPAIAPLQPSASVEMEAVGAGYGLAGPDRLAFQRAEIDRLRGELIAIRQASANTIQIQSERDRLQEHVIKLEQELEIMRREKNALDSDNRQDWFLIGSGVLFFGILLGVFLPRLSWRKTPSWNSF